MYLCVSSNDFASFYDFDVGFLNCSDIVIIFFVFFPFYCVLDLCTFVLFYLSVVIDPYNGVPCPNGVIMY